MAGKHCTLNNCLLQRFKGNQALLSFCSYYGKNKTKLHFSSGDQQSNLSYTHTLLKEAHQRLEGSLQ